MVTQKKDSQIILRIPKDVKGDLLIVAKKNELTLSELLYYCILSFLSNIDEAGSSVKEFIKHEREVINVGNNLVTIIDLVRGLQGGLKGSLSCLMKDVAKKEADLKTVNNIIKGVSKNGSIKNKGL